MENIDGDRARLLSYLAASAARGNRLRHSKRQLCDCGCPVDANDPWSLSSQEDILFSQCSSHGQQLFRAPARAFHAIWTREMSRAEFAILGAGAIGSLLAAHLARKGHCVTVLERGQRTQTIQNEGLQIRGLAEFSTGVEVLTERLTPRNNESAERVTEKKRM